MRCDLTRPRPLCAEDEYAFTALQGEASRRRVGSFGTTRRLRRIQVRLVRCLQDVSLLTALRGSPALRCELGVRFSRSRGNALPLGQTREKPDRLSGSFCSNRAEFVKEWSSLLGWIEILHCGKPLT